MLKAVAEMRMRRVSTSSSGRRWLIIDLVVCVKQVPRTGEVEVDPETGNLVREGVASQTNPYDLHALEAALAWRDRLGGTVTALSMGPPQAEEVLREALWMGADKGVLLSDVQFAGADTLATSYTLARAISRLDYDIILCGMQTTDGDTAQVGPGVAEFLGIPHVSYVNRIDGFRGEAIEITTDLAGDEAALQVQLPCLITVTRELNQPRLPSFRRRLATERDVIPVWSRTDVEGARPNYFGLEGSPTRVDRVFAPEAEAERETWRGDPPCLGRRLAAKLRELRFL